MIGVINTSLSTQTSPNLGVTSYSLALQQTAVSRLEELKRFLLVTAPSSTAWHQHQRKQIATEEIIRINQLKDNWDGEGAVEVAQSAIDMALALLSFLPDVISAPDVSPNPNGTISLHWALPHGSAELEIGKTRHSWVFLTREGSASQTCSGNNRAFEHHEPIHDLIRALIPQRFGEMGTPPLTNLTMLSPWNSVLEAF